MLNREFPEGLIIEQSSIGNLSRKCGISELDSKYITFSVLLEIKKIQLIQRQVKSWLLRRQRLDID